MKNKLLTAFLLLPFMIAAQQNYRITGKISDDKNQAVSTAMVILQTIKDSTVVTATYADDKGQYELATPNIKEVQLRFEAPGYITKWEIIPSNDSRIIVNTILKNDNILKEVTVISTKPVYERKMDRMIFNVENSVSATGGDAWDAIRKSPGVLVLNNQLTVGGKGSVGVMINGRLQQVSGDDLVQLLRSIPSDNLSKVEVITSPSAKYDAEGTTGLINVVTKKNLQQGLKGSITASYNQNTYGSPALSTSLNYRREKLNIYANANVSTWGWKYTNRTSTPYPDKTWNQILDLGSMTLNARAQAGVDYNITSRAIVGLLFTEAYTETDNDYTLLYTSSGAPKGTDSTLRTTGKTHELFKNKRSLNLNYEWRINDNGRKLNIDADYYTHAGTRERTFGTHHLRGDGTSIGNSDSRMTGSPAIDINSIKMDLEWPTPIINLSAGSKFSYVRNEMDNIYENKVGDNYIVDLQRTDAFTYNEKILSGYVDAQKKIGSFSLKAGVRAENTKATGHSVTLSQTNTNRYLRFFPSAFAQYEVAKDHMLSLTYNRRINRPGYNLLNPFKFYNAPNSYLQGNPYLLPAYNHGAELQYALRSKYFFSVYGGFVNNYWDRMIITDSAEQSINLTHGNMGTNTSAGLSTEIIINPATWWECRVNTSFDYRRYDLEDQFGSRSRFDVWYWWFQSTHSFTLNKSKTLFAEINGYYNSPRRRDYRQWEEMSCINLGFKALLCDRKLVVALNANDIFAKAYWMITNTPNGATQYTYDDERSLRLSITYKFGNNSVKNKRDRATTTEEMQRANQQ